jgi:hypothetical protein
MRAAGATVHIRALSHPLLRPVLHKLIDFVDVFNRLDRKPFDVHLLIRCLVELQLKRILWVEEVANFLVVYLAVRAPHQETFSHVVGGANSSEYMHERVRNDSS